MISQTTICRFFRPNCQCLNRPIAVYVTTQHNDNNYRMDVLDEAHGNDLMGYVEFHHTDSDLWFLEYINVAPNYQRQGVGTELIRRSVDALGHAKIRVSTAAREEDPDSTFWLTEDGAALINHCINRGVLPRTVCANHVEHFHG